MDIVADESVDYAIVKSLREIGFKVYSILEQSVTNILHSSSGKLANNFSVLNEHGIRIKIIKA